VGVADDDWDSATSSDSAERCRTAAEMASRIAVRLAELAGFFQTIAHAENEVYLGEPKTKAETRPEGGAP
jgi:hypothetical protein